MGIRVLKYGGASLATTNHLLNIAKEIKALFEAGEKVLLVVSAMGSSTNELIEKAASISRHPDRRELDMLISTGERVSMSLMSMALNDIGVPAISFTGSQAGILTTNSHTGANIIEVKAFRVQEALDEGKVVVLAGFQGVCPETKEITTLGRGGTDTTAVAMADYLKASSVEMLKDVDGVFNADPKLLDTAKKFQSLGYDQFLAMCEAGAKVVHEKAVQMAKEKNIRIHIKKAHDPSSVGTIIQEQNINFNKAYALNHCPSVYEFKWKADGALETSEIRKELQFHLSTWNFPDLKILDIFSDNSETHFLLRGTNSNLDFFVKALEDDKRIELHRSDLSELSLSLPKELKLPLIQDSMIYRHRKDTNNEYFILEKKFVPTFINKQLTSYLS